MKELSPKQHDKQNEIITFYFAIRFLLFVVFCFFSFYSIKKSELENLEKAIWLYLGRVLLKCEYFLYMVSNWNLDFVLSSLLY